MLERVLITFNETYKETKETWVTGYTGTTGAEVALVVAAVPACIFLNSALVSFLNVSGLVRPTREWHPVARFLLEFIVITVPGLLSMTVGCGGESIENSWSWAIVIGAVVIAIALHLVAATAFGKPLLSLNANLPGHALQWLYDDGRKTFISSYRSGMMMLTTVSILAVDFIVFPRRNVKSETFGTSLMDMGVGAFVFSAAIVSRQTRRLQCTNSNRTTGGGDLISMENGRRRTRIRTDGSCATLLNSAASAALETVRAVSPLLFLGFIRLIGHTAVNYQVHVSEYGVHWNFFFTMASVALLATVLEVSWTCGCRIVGSSGDSSSAADGKDASSGDSSSSSKLKKRGMALSRTTTAALYLVAGIAIATIYQLAIMQRLPAWIINSSRNAEGKMIDVNAPVVHGGLGPDTYCASMKRIGTVQDFVLCAPRYIEAPDSLGYAFLMQNREGIGGILGFFAIYLCGVGLGVLLLAPRRTAGEWRSFFLRSSAGAAALWMALWWAVQPENAGPVSRRLVNAPYVLWVLAFNWTMLLSLLFVDMVSVIYCDKDTPLLKTRQEVLIVNHELEVMGGVAETTGMINDGASVAASELDTPTAQAAGANPAAALLVAPRAAAAPLNFVSGGSVSTSGLRKRRGSVTASAAPSASGAAPQLQSSPGASTTDRSRRSTGRTTVSRSVAAAAVASSASTESDDAAQSSGVSSTSTTAAGGRKRGSSKGRKAAVVGAGGSASVVESPISSVDGDGGCGSGAAALPASRAASVGSGQSQQSSKAAAPQLDQSSCSVGGSNRTLDSAGSGGGGSKRQQRSGFLWSLLSIASSIMLQKPRPFPEHVTSGGSVILDSFNVNFLAIFMVANLLVGVVNLTVYTVHAPVSTAMVLLTLYMAAVCGTATAWRTMGVTLKFW